MKFVMFIIVPAIALLSSCSTTTMEPADSPTATLHYSLASQTFVRVFVENSYGVVVLQAVNQAQPAGTYLVNVRLTGVPEGLYFAIVSVDGSEIQKLSMFVVKR